MLRARAGPSRRPRRSRSSAWLQWLLLFGFAAYSVAWLSHQRRAVPPAARNTCAARLAAFGLAPPQSSSDAGSSELRLVPAAATAHVTGATLSRRILYDSMARQLDTGPLRVGAVATQGLQQDSLFAFEGDRVRPLLKRLDVPVRAVVAPFPDKRLSARLSGALARHLTPHLAPAGAWLQDSSMYHSTIWHASHHQNPVPADAAAVGTEAAAVRAVGAAACPMHVALERVVATASGTVLACWQLVDGTEPAELRRRLAAALPNAPHAEVQAIRQQEILHTTLARVLKPPPGDGRAGTAALQRAVAAISAELCGLETMLHEIWYIEELDLLALALGGEFRSQPAPLECKGTR